MKDIYFGKIYPLEKHIAVTNKQPLYKNQIKF